mgnify:CR=1 FL=1|jgi:hypothetical protein|tara:strand:+ start:709 stop:960 length:252 start_codon:yes stop_codon:yes gene_type:complete
MDQVMLDKMAKQASEDYTSKIITAPFKQARVFGITIEGSWQVERRFVDNVKRCTQLATAFKLINPFEGLALPEVKEPGLLDEG